MAAHYGNGFGLDSCRISYDAPIIILERLRRDKVRFDKNYFGMASFLDDDLLGYFLRMVSPVASLLNVSDNGDVIKSELESYINAVISAAKEKSLLPK